jgi:DNA polymerase-3 subunit delta
MEVKYSQLTDERLRTPARAYLLQGDEPVLQREFLERLRGVLQLQAGSMDEATIDARQTPADTVWQLLQTLPMEQAQRLVILQAASRYSASELQTLAQRIPQIPPFSCLVILSDSPSEEGSGESATRRGGWQAIVNAVRTHGVVVVLESLRGKSLETRLIEAARAAGKRLQPPEAQYLMELVDGVAELALMELQKVLLYVAARTEITREDIEQVVSPSQSAQVFKLVDAIVAGNTAEALRWLRLLFQAGTRAETAALQTLGLISRQFRLLWDTRLLIEHRQPIDSPEAVSEMVARKLLREPNVVQLLQRQPFLRERLRRQAERFPLPRLKRAFAALRDADFALKGVQASVNPAEVMERLIVKLTTQV